MSSFKFKTKDSISNSISPLVPLRTIFFLFLSLFLFSSLLLAKESSPVTVRFVSEITSLQPSSTFKAGVQFHMAKGWHIYYKNPGQSGKPTQVEWILPKGWKVDPLV
jgi:DsbC/DsbD-like thiol-disulfide interchange protein